MEEHQPNFKILMFPFIAHSHISTYLQLSKKLSTTKHFHLYICSTSVILDSIRSHLPKQNPGEQSITLIKLDMPSSPELPPELHTTKNAPSHLLPILFQAFDQSRFKFSQIMDSLKPHLLLYDIYQPWAPQIASSKGVPSVLFPTGSVAPFSLCHHLHSYGKAEKTVSAFPFPNMIIPQNLQRLLKGESLVMSYLPENFSCSTEIVLANSCKEIEGKYGNHLSDLSKKKIVFAGPLMADDRESNLDEEGSKILKWLAGKKPNSTVYISFGSECFLSKDQMREMAKAIELCDVNFIWVLRFPAAGAVEELPEGFIERVGGRGLVVEWAPQTKVLAHSSVGAFVSHCGWNSTVESFYFGVPVVAVPMNYDQPYNARLAAEVGVGVEVERGGGGCYAGEDVAEAIKKVMWEERFLKEAKMLSKKMRMNEEERVNEVVEELLRICRKNVR